MRIFSIILSFLWVLNGLKAQETFVRQMDNSDDYYVFNLAVDDSSDLALLMYDPALHSINFYYAFLAPPYDEVKAYRIFKPGVLFSFPFNFSIGKDYLISQHDFGWLGDLSGAGIFYMDTSLQNYWLYYKPYFGQGFFDESASGDIFILNAVRENGAPYGPNVVEAFVLSSAGDILFKRGLDFSINGEKSYQFYVEEIEIDKLNGVVYALLFYSGLGPDDGSGSVLLALDESLNVLSSVRILDYHYHDLSLSANGSLIYLLGQYEGQPLPEVEGGALIAAFDSNFTLQWSKLYYAENFDYRQTSLNVRASGEAVLAYSTEGAFPTILSMLDTTGETGQQTGYPFYEPFVNVFPDGALALASNNGFDQSANTFNQITLAKTDAEGNIEGCDVFSTCLLSEDFGLDFSGVEVDTISITPLEPLSVEVDPWQFVFSDGCEIPSAPSPEFSFPDSLCVGECAAVEDTHNANAHGIRWVLTGPTGVLTEQEDYQSFSYCFDDSGTYTLTQTVWFLGCPYSYTHQIVVLEDLSLNIIPDGVVCGEPPINLSVNASRTLVNYLWSGGSTNPYLEINQSGTYWLEADDGYCEMRDTIALTFWEDLLTEGPALLLPKDTSVCERYLPFVLKPASPYVNTFSLPDVSSLEKDSFLLWSPGSYEVVADIFGCETKDTFFFSVNDCTAHIYVPSAFSPDSDGINDVFSPVGLLQDDPSKGTLFKEFQGLHLQIYDRWGNLQFTAEESPFEWDGRNANGVPLSNGVYLYVFDYWNILAGEAERLYGDILLIR